MNDLTTTLRSEIKLAIHRMLQNQKLIGEEVLTKEEADYFENNIFTEENGKKEQ